MPAFWFMEKDVQKNSNTFSIYSLTSPVNWTPMWRWEIWNTSVDNWEPF